MIKLYNAKQNSIYWSELLKIPEFQALKETPQNQIWHKEGNAYTHTCLVTQHMLDYISLSDNKLFKDPNYCTILVLAALLHDIGKTVTTEIGDDGLYHCKDHTIKGVEIAERILNTYFKELPDTSKEAILSLVRYHMQPLYILNSKDPKKAILKIVNNLKYVSFESLLLLKRCDCEGSIYDEDDHYLEKLDTVRKLYYEVCSYPAETEVFIRKIGNADSSPYAEGEHPNGINTGYINQGTLLFPITIGYRTFIGDWFSTSPVVKIIDKNHFQTMNSLYEITESLLTKNK